MAGKAVAVAQSSPEDLFPMLFGGEKVGNAVALIRDAVNGENVTIADLDRVKIPTGGGEYWQVPDSTPTEELVGVLLAYGTPRTYWEFGMNEPEHKDGAPPDCSSDDGKFGRPVRIDPETGDEVGGRYGVGSELHPEGDCETCPMNEWGTARHGASRGKACSELRTLYFLMAGSLLPVVVGLPPTSLKPFKQHIIRTASKGVPFYGVVTRIGLDQAKGPGGKYSFATFSRVPGGELSADQAEQMRLLGDYFISQDRARLADIGADEYDVKGFSKADEN